MEIERYFTNAQRKEVKFDLDSFRKEKRTKD